MHRHFRMFAAYNQWANRLVYEACAGLTDEEYRTDKGAFFGSAHRTLNHLLTADRIWLRRITGEGSLPATLDAILFDDFSELRAARTAEDERIIAVVDSLTEEKLAASFTYTPISNPVPITQPLGPVLSHLFNHQTHHRGQLHMILTALGKPSLVLDLVYFIRSEGKQWM
jgi:uncharacterized damage-inducible protein DinB